MWIEDSGRDVTSAFVGITTPARDLYEEIERRGWTVSDVSIKDGQYSCQIKNPDGEKIEKSGPDQNTAVGHALMALIRQETMRQPRVANWNWGDQVGDIARAYAEAPAYDTKAAAAWKELADDMSARAQAIKQQIEVEYVADPDPYKDINEMCEDVIKNRHISISQANIEHPIWNRNQVLDYRLVRDVLGHCQAGGDYSWYGENQATAAMMPLLSENAQKALFTESIGQAAYNNHYRGYGPQKITFLDLDQSANDPTHVGVHPSQTLVPGEIARTSAAQADPNANWESGIHPLPDNAYLWTRDSVTGLDPLDWQGARDAAAQIDTRWHSLSNPDGDDHDTKRQAVVNALRAAVLAPRKPMQWASTHYQHVSTLPARVSDPMRFWDTLEERRDDHNQSIGLEPGVHRYAWAPEEQAFKQWITSVEPQLDPNQVERKAQEQLFHMLAEEEQRIMQEDDKGQMTSDEIERKAHKAIRKRLKLMTKGKFDEKTDNMDMLYAAASQLGSGPYHPYLANQVKALAGVGRNADTLLASALRDVREGGKGHEFRKEVLRLGLPNVGPREASHAWLLLQPQSSDLAVLDPHLKDVLDHKPDVINDRDYFKLERQLSAGRDAAGYNHVPLGMFGWAMSDHKRGGHGHHRDHRSMRVINPLPHHEDDVPEQEKWKAPHWWKATEDARNQIGKQFDAEIGANYKSTEIPFQKVAYKGMGPVQSFDHWWDKEKPINPKKAKILAEYAAGEKMSQKQVNDYLDRHKDEVTDFKDFKKKFMKSFKRYKQSSNGGRIPYFVHTDGSKVEGAAGSPLMRHIRDQTGLTTQQIWEQIAEAGKR